MRHRGHRHGLSGRRRAGQYAHFGKRATDFSAYWHRRKYARHVRGGFGRLRHRRGYWSNDLRGTYRRHKYGYRYRHGNDFRDRDGRFPWVGLPWTPYYFGPETVGDFVCQKLYETALTVDNSFYWDDYHTSCDDPEAYPWFEAYLTSPDLPLRK